MGQTNHSTHTNCYCVLAPEVGCHISTIRQEFAISFNNLHLYLMASILLSSQRILSDQRDHTILLAVCLLSSLRGWLTSFRS